MDNLLQQRESGPYSRKSSLNSALLFSSNFQESVLALSLLRDGSHTSRALYDV